MRATGLSWLGGISKGVRYMLKTETLRKILAAIRKAEEPKVLVPPVDHPMTHFERVSWPMFRERINELSRW